MLKCIAIGGMPATGKSTLARAIYNEMGNTLNFKFGTLRGHLNQDKTISLLGLYDNDDTFPGTDRLSMAVNPDFVRYAERQQRHIIFEGDRLFTLNNLRLLSNLYQLRVVILENSDENLAERQKIRGSKQSEKFIKGRKTKVSKIRDGFEGRIDAFTLNEIHETFSLRDALLDWISTDTE